MRYESRSDSHLGGWSSFWGLARPRRPRRPRSVPLRLEPLEDRITPSGGPTLSTLAPFNGTNGQDPYAALITDSSGNLYGTTQQGGTSNFGAVFELAKGSHMITTLASFNGTNGQYPYAGVIRDSSGNLYGTTYEGGASNSGTVFELAKGSGTITTLASFNGTNGSFPEAGLILDGSGNLYGTTGFGGASDDGTVFEVAHGSGTITTLASFNDANGRAPFGALILDSSGNLYGTTFNGGAFGGAGTVFELAKGSGTITTLASFNGTDGSNPIGALILDSSGNLYGTAELGGASSDGTVYELAHGSHTITTLASFNGSNGSFPQGSVIMDSSGNLYDTTAYGGASNFGTVFELAHGSHTITTLASFNGTNGQDPFGGVILGSSGNLYGTTQQGGASGDGAVFELAKGSGTITTLASFFNGTNGVYPLGGEILDGSGNLYGTTQQGGASNFGTVYELAHGSHTITTLASFDGTNGSSPEAGLTLDSSGNLYGTTAYGGPSGDGTVFELAHGSGTITALASFNGTNGTSPRTGVILDSSGNLYGTTAYGGAFQGPIGDGTVFELAHGSHTITTLASFNDTDGAYPGGGVILDTSGNLYGTTQEGGASDDGTVFELAHGSHTITTLASFNGTNGRELFGGVILDSSGNLYGTTQQGGASGDGAVFELAKGSGTITTLASFNGTNGLYPYVGLILDSSGNLYGTTPAGGASSDGTVFEVAHGSHTITTLASFNGTNGQSPYGGVILDSSGNLYGTTEHGGAFQGPFGGYGTVFELAKGSGTITTLASFNDDTAGANPFGGVIRDSSGNLYGTTFYGGASGDGTVFELAKGSGTITTLASFNDTDGAHPCGGVILDSSGNLYGTTEQGGASGDGTVFELAHGSHSITTLASFNGTNGASPLAGLILDGSGNLYGTTKQGGASSDGTVFELAHGSHTITTLASFNGTNGQYPYGGVILDSSGNLYGTTQEGGASGDGTVFELTHGSHTIATLASFNGTNGASPLAGLILDGSGNLYGTTKQGGASSDGTVFELAHGSHTITTLASFNGTNGQYPYGGVILDSSGNLYGTTEQGGASGDGTVFELIKGSGTITSLVSFNGSNGAYPSYGLIQDSSRNLYGTTYGGSASGDGTVFELKGAITQTDQWTGAHFAVDTNWSDGANWSLGTPPTTGQTALFTKNSSVKDFASTVNAGFTSSIGTLDIDSTWGGTITVNTALSVTGNFTLASGSFGGNGAVTIAGIASQWSGGQIDVGTGGFANTGTLTIAGTGTENLKGGTLTNIGTIDQTGAGTLQLGAGATLLNGSKGTYDIEAAVKITGGTITNAGTLEQTKGTGTSTISSALSNTGKLFVNTGTVDVSGKVTQVSGTTLTAGTWQVTGSSTVHSTLDITSAPSLTTVGSKAAVTLSGLNTTFANLAAVTTNQGIFSLLGGQSFTTKGSFTNSGKLTLGPGSTLTVKGNFTETAAGKLTVEIGGTNTSPTIGAISATGKITLAGSLSVTDTAKVIPAVGSVLTLLEDPGSGPISGTFTGLAEGSTIKITVGTTTITFKISYKGGSTGKSVTLKRIS